MTISLSASDIHQIYKPSYCELRYWLLNSEQYMEHELGIFEQLIIDLGIRHEKKQLDHLDNYLDCSEGKIAERIKLTIEKLQEQNVVLYQPVLTTNMHINDKYCSLIGIPDFIIIEDGRIIVRDVKLAKNITERDHPEIILQMQLYGLLIEKVTGMPACELQVLNGENQIIRLTGDYSNVIVDLLSKLIYLRDLPSAPYSPVGVSKCKGCIYNESCWQAAIDKKDTALIPGVDQNLTSALREIGINDYESLLESFDEKSLAELKRLWGNKMQRVGKKSTEILRNAESLKSNTEIPIKPVLMPKHDNYVMFDLEGLPPYIHEIEKIYIWGIQVFGKEPTEFMPAVSGFGTEGDYEGWQDFLGVANKIFDKYGDIPWVHWHVYEKTKIKLYIERFGDRDDIAQRVLDNLLDILPITQQSIALPVYSYSLKIVEKYLGFIREQSEYGGDWSIAKYIEAIETSDLNARDKLLAEVLKYNEEDLKATWLVTEWLLNKV